MEAAHLQVKRRFMSDLAFPYILQPIAEDRLKKCILIVEFIFLWLS
jgi:hypothetical protein